MDPMTLAIVAAVLLVVFAGAGYFVLWARSRQSQQADEMFRGHGGGDGSTMRLTDYRAGDPWTALVDEQMLTDAVTRPPVSA